MSAAPVPDHDRPIGVFDSGVGGLTVLRALQQELPFENTVYLGDTARVPYGTKSSETVKKYALNIARTLVVHNNIKLLVVACNTATAHALEVLQQTLPIPVVGVIAPGAAQAAAASRGGTIAVLGTAGLVRSGAYDKALAVHGQHRVVSQACPLFVPLAEEGWVSGEVPTLVAQSYLRALPGDIDTVVMGCTHYPLLEGVLRDLLPPAVNLINGATATAREVRGALAAGGMLRTGGAGTHHLWVTDAPEQLRQLAPLFLGREVDAAQVAQIDVLMEHDDPR